MNASQKATDYMLRFSYKRKGSYFWFRFLTITFLAFYK